MARIKTLKYLNNQDKFRIEYHNLNEKSPYDEDISFDDTKRLNELRNDDAEKRLTFHEWVKDDQQKSFLEFLQANAVRETRATRSFAIIFSILTVLVITAPFWMPYVIPTLFVAFSSALVVMAACTAAGAILFGAMAVWQMAKRAMTQKAFKETLHVINDDVAEDEKSEEDKEQKNDEEQFDHSKNEKKVEDKKNEQEKQPDKLEKEIVKQEIPKQSQDPELIQSGLSLGSASGVSNTLPSVESTQPQHDVSSSPQSSLSTGELKLTDNAGAISKPDTVNPLGNNNNNNNSHVIPPNAAVMTSYAAVTKTMKRSLSDTNLIGSFSNEDFSITEDSYEDETIDNLIRSQMEQLTQSLLKQDDVSEKEITDLTSSLTYSILESNLNLKKSDHQDVSRQIQKFATLIEEETKKAQAETEKKSNANAVVSAPVNGIISPKPIYLRTFAELLETEKNYCQQASELNNAIERTFITIKAHVNRWLNWFNSSRAQELAAIEKLKKYHLLADNPFEGLDDNLTVDTFDAKIDLLYQQIVSNRLSMKVSNEIIIGCKVDLNRQVIGDMNLHQFLSQDQKALEHYVIIPIQRLPRRELVFRDVVNAYQKSPDCKSETLQKLMVIQKVFIGHTKFINSMQVNAAVLDSQIMPEFVSEATKSIYRTAQAEQRKSCGNQPAYVDVFKKLYLELGKIIDKTKTARELERGNKERPINAENFTIYNFSERLAHFCHEFEMCKAKLTYSADQKIAIADMIKDLKTSYEEFGPSEKGLDLVNIKELEDEFQITPELSATYKTSLTK